MSRQRRDEEVELLKPEAGEPEHETYAGDQHPCRWYREEWVQPSCGELYRREGAQRHEGPLCEGYLPCRPEEEIEASRGEAPDYDPVVKYAKTPNATTT
jgi:hypothetical protein